MHTSTTKRTLSLNQFCHRYGISRSMFYKLRDRKQGPKEFRVGNRVLITMEAAEEWCRQRERECGSTAPSAGSSEPRARSTADVPTQPQEAPDV